MKRQRTFVAKPEDIQREWYVVDATGKTLGRLASQIARILQGKHKPYYTPHLDCGDYVIVVNAHKIKVTGNKLDQKRYYWQYYNRPGHIKSRTLREQLQKHPERVLEHAVRGMLPKNRLGRKMFKKLKVYASDTHPHQAQNPKPLDL